MIKRGGHEKIKLTKKLKTINSKKIIKIYSAICAYNCIGTGRTYFIGLPIQCFKNANT
jgi:hypothetical protein